MKSNLWSTHVVALFVLGAIAGSAGASPQGTKPKLTLPGGGNWMATKVTPSVVAANTDKRMSVLATTIGEFHLKLKWRLGTVGQFVGKLWIKDPRTYRIEYLSIGRDESDAAGTGLMVADGQRFTDFKKTGWTKPVRFDNRKIMPSSLLSDLPVYVDQWIFAGVGGGPKPLTALVKEINRPGSGFTVKTEELWSELNGQKVVSYRLRIERTAAKAKSIGSYFGEVVIDGTHWVPKLIRIIDRAKGKAASGVEMRMLWKLKYDKAFDSSLFKITH